MKDIKRPSSRRRNAKKLLDIKVEKPRKCVRQTKRENHDVQNYQDFSRVHAYTFLYWILRRKIVETHKFSREVLDGYQLNDLDLIVRFGSLGPYICAICLHYIIFIYCTVKTNKIITYGLIIWFIKISKYILDRLV